VQTLDGVAAALKANDIDGVWSYLTDDAQFSRGKAREALGMIRVDDAKYSQLDVQVNELTSPWTAEVTFFGVIYFTDKNGMSPYNQYPKRFKLIMRKIGDRWLIENHEEL
jgi:ketosteroid isomerase-like protein